MREEKGGIADKRKNMKHSKHLQKFIMKFGAQKIMECVLITKHSSISIPETSLLLIFLPLTTHETAFCVSTVMLVIRDSVPSHYDA